MSVMDDIRTFVPDSTAEDYEARDKLRSARNMATKLMSQSQSRSAIFLASMASDYATASIYTEMPLAELEATAQLCRRLLVTALQAERLDMGDFR